MAFVLDCSVTMSWIMVDEDVSSTLPLLDALAETHAMVPSLWIFEVSNVLSVATRRQRIDQSEGLRLVEQLLALPIHIDQRAADTQISALQRIAIEQAISAYDAAYLELAMRMQLPLATLDNGLANVAARLGVIVLPEPLESVGLPPGKERG